MRLDSRSQNRKLNNAEASQGTKDGSLNRKQKVRAPVPPRTKQEIEAETIELNTHAKQVFDSYTKLKQMW